MDFKQVQTFVTLAKYLHFGRTASNLRISQPHVSRRINQLEDDLGVSLFQRDKRNVKLTKAGEVFSREARAILKDIELARLHARESALGRRGKLNISLVSSAMLGILPTIVKDFRTLYPDVHVDFKELGSAAQSDALIQEKTDVAFFHPALNSTNLFNQILLETDKMVAILPVHHRLASRKTIKLIELAEEPWIMFPRDDNSQIFDRMIATCNKAGFSPVISQEAATVHTRLGLVACGFGVHLAGESWKKNPYPGVVYVPVQPTVSLAMYCYWRQNDSNIILGLFTDVVRKHLG